MINEKNIEYLKFLIKILKRNISFKEENENEESDIVFRGRVGSKKEGFKLSLIIRGSFILLSGDNDKKSNRKNRSLMDDKNATLL